MREKLARAEEAVKDNHLYDNNVEDLKKIQPEKLGINQIHFRLGSPWVPTETIEGFIGEFFDFKDAKVELYPGYGQLPVHPDHKQMGD